MANTFTKIATTEVGAGGIASIDFTSIPQTYTHLYVVYSLRTNSSPFGYGYNNCQFRVNGQTTGRSDRYLVNDNGSAGSYAGGNHRLDVASSSNTANTFSSTSFYIPNYTSAAYKSWSADHTFESSGGYYQMGIMAGLESNTAAITSLSYVCLDTNFVQYSSATLYGITKGSGGATVS